MRAHHSIFGVAAAWVTAGCLAGAVVAPTAPKVSQLPEVPQVRQVPPDGLIIGRDPIRPLPPPPAPLGAPAAPTTWRPAVTVPPPEPQYLVLYRCTTPQGVVTYASSPGAGCVFVNVQAF